MPTIKTIKPAGGGDYTTLQAWEDWADGEATADQWAECYRGNTGNVDITGWSSTPDANNYPRIYAAEGERHKGDVNQNPLEVVRAGAGGAVYEIYDVRVAYTRVEGVWFLNTYANGVQVEIGSTAAVNVMVAGCLHTEVSGTGAGVGCVSGATGIVVRNCLSKGLKKGLVWLHKNGHGSIYNCTAIGGSECTYGFSRAAGGGATGYLTATNCIAVEFSTACFFRVNVAVDCLSSDTTGGDPTVRTAEEIFSSPSNDDYTLKLGSPAIKAGANLADEFDTDILGRTRPLYGAWDMGAFMYVNMPAGIADVNRLFDDPSSLVGYQGYDSRSNLTLSVDAKGNSSVTVFDGASRATQLQQHLRQRGQGDQPPAANTTLLPFGGSAILSRTVYDANSRVSQIVDDNDNVTAYEYDSLDRQVAMTYHDGSTVTRVFNTASNPTTVTDANGSVFTNTFDSKGRNTASSISLASGVIGTTAQSFQYDGLNRTTFARDSMSTTHADVSLDYDSLSRVLEDSQTFGGNTRNATNTKFESYPAVEFTFPDGRTIENTFDLLYRRTLVHDPAGGGTDIAAWEFFGPVRVAEMTLGNGLICSHLNNDRTRSAIQDGETVPAWGNQSSDRLGYDGAGRMITKRWLAGGINGTTHAYNDATAVVGQTTAYDRSSNKLYERSLQAESRSSAYELFDANGKSLGGYDSIDRLRQYQRGTLATGGGSVSTAISLPNTDESRTYNLDGLGNWRRTAFDPVGGAEETQIRQHNGLNQITRTTESSVNTDFEYDGAIGASNGNLKNDGVRKYEWDALNRLKKVSKTPATPVTIAEYDYDALNRRIRKVVSNGGLSGNITNGTTDFVYTAMQCCEDRNGSNVVTKQYVWGRYIDELLQQKNLVAINGFAANDELYPLCDTLYRVLALTDDTGTVREAYDYDAYGNTRIFRNTGSPPSAILWTDSDTQVEEPTCDFEFTSRRFDAETQMYFYRRRYYLPPLGRFVSRDPIGYADGYGPYVYVSNRSLIALDPEGTFRAYPKTPAARKAIQAATNISSLK